MTSKETQKIRILLIDDDALVSRSLTNLLQREGYNVVSAGASQYLKVSTEALYDLAKGRKISCFKVGRRWRFRKSTINHWMDKQERAAF